MTLMMVSREGDEVTIETKGRGVAIINISLSVPKMRPRRLLPGPLGRGSGHVLGLATENRVAGVCECAGAGVYELGPRDVIDYAELQQMPATYNNHPTGAVSNAAKKAS